MTEWGEMTLGQLMEQLDGQTAYKFEMQGGKLSLRVDGLMGSLKKMSRRAARKSRK